MSTKTIATRLVIEGEKETRAAISAINSDTDAQSPNTHQSIEN